MTAPDKFGRDWKGTQSNGSLRIPSETANERYTHSSIQILAGMGFSLLTMSSSNVT
jgi:hypothetical protein